MGDTRFVTKYGRFYLGDAREVLKELPSGCIDAVITDPPYKEGYEVFFDEMVPELYRVCKDNCWLAFYWPSARLSIPFEYGITKWFKYRDAIVVITKRSGRFSSIGRKQTLLILLLAKGNPKLYARTGDLMFAEEDPELMPKNPRLEDWRPTFPTQRSSWCTC